MAEASKICPYTQEYLSLMARRGLIQAKKVGRNWYTNVDAINEHLKLTKPEEIVIIGQEKEKYKLTKQREVSNFQKKYFNFRLTLVYTTLVLIVAFIVYKQVSDKLAQNESKKRQGSAVSREITESSNSVAPYFTRGEKFQF